MVFKSAGVVTDGDQWSEEEAANDGKMKWLGQVWHTSHTCKDQTLSARK